MRLSDVARHVVQPDGIVSTGWPSVRDTCKRLGWGFDGWQDGSGRLILAKDKDGLYAARDGVVISIPRQVGKTYLLGAIIFALCLLNPNLTVIWTAHRVKTAKETFGSMQGMAARSRVKPHIKRVSRARGDESIEFTNGSRILFGAREAGFGRGFAGVDILVFDEAQILGESALEDMLAAQNVSPNALTLYAGTPPRPKDPGEVFTRFRQEAIDGTSDATLYIELSADPDAQVLDREQWRKANPSYPHRTTERAILRLIKQLAPDSVKHEVLGIWDETAHKPVISKAAWGDLTARGLMQDIAATALGVDATGDGVFFAAGCWVDGDDAHVELLPLPTDLIELADLIAKRCKRRIPVLIHSTSAAKPLVPLLTARHVKAKLIAGPDLATATGLIISDLRAGRLTHIAQKQLTDGVMAGRRIPYGKGGAEVWDLKTATAPLMAATLARLGASETTKKRSTAGRVVVMT